MSAMSLALTTEPVPGTTRVPVVRHTEGAVPMGTRPALAIESMVAPVMDHVIDEQPVALVYNGLSHVVMMATPLDLEDFALGFSLSEGLLLSLDEVRDLTVEPGALGVSVHLDVSPRVFARFKDHRRQLAGRTGCGLCGIDSLAAFHASLPQSTVTPCHDVSVAAIVQAFRALPARQALQAQTGACHAAGWAQPDGSLSLVREDVGRHNALDKLIGALVRQGMPLPSGLAVVSSRASHEMVSKCVRLGMGGMAAISAPTALAIDLARRSGLRLFGFCRNDSAVVYA
jgi:FdhD protein